MLSEAKGVVVFIWKHPANRGRRGRQLIRAAGFHLLSRVCGWRAVTRVGEGGARIWVDVHRTAATKALYANPPDWPQMGIWERHLREGDVFIDVGANVGTYSVMAAAAGAQVIAVEPAHDSAELLRENAVLNDFPIVVIEAVVGAETGVVGFTTGRDALNRVDPQAERKVSQVTLDSLVGERTVAGVKIDVEGSELMVLMGASRALNEQRIRLLQLEWNDLAERGPVERLLRSAGYCLLEPTEEGGLQTSASVTSACDLFAAPCGSR